MDVLAPPTGFSGEILTPAHPGYDAARAHFDVQIDRRPAEIALCRNEADVQAAVRHAREQGLEIAVRSGGHSVPGYSSVDGGILIDLKGLDGIEIDAGARRARVQPGLAAGEVQTALGRHGLVAMAGLEPMPGYVGLAIHGGRGLLGRRHGWASDHIRAARVVLSTGEVVTVSADEHADLLYGLRGLGSSFGIVTELEVDVHPIPATVTGGPRIYGPEQLRDFLPALLELFEDGVSDDLGALMTFFSDGDGPHLELVLLHIGNAADADREFARIDALAEPLEDRTTRISYADFLGASDHPPVDRFVWAEQGSELPPADLADVLLDLARALPRPTTPGLPTHYLVSEPFGRGFQRQHDLPTPVPRRSGWNIAFFGAWSDAAEDAAMHAWATTGRDELERSGAGNGIPVLNYNSVTGPSAVRRAYGEEAYRRLQDLKRRYDPEDVFHLNHGGRADSAAK
jgi:FAD/FMN-containing dehydrogenase